MTLLKNTSSLSILARYIKNGDLRSIMRNVIDFNRVSRLTDPIDELLPIPKFKFANPAVVLSSCTEVFSCCNTFS